MTDKEAVEAMAVAERADALDALRYRALRDALVVEGVVEFNEDYWIAFDPDADTITAEGFDEMLDAWIAGGNAG